MQAITGQLIGVNITQLLIPVQLKEALKRAQSIQFNTTAGSRLFDRMQKVKIFFWDFFRDDPEKKSLRHITPYQ